MGKKAKRLSLYLITLTLLGFSFSNTAWGTQLLIPSSVTENLDTRFTGIYINYGDGYANKKEFDLAESSYRKAIELEPDNVQAQYRLGLVLEIQRNFKEAEQVYRNILAKNPKEMQAYYSLGLVLDQLNQSEESIQTLKKALDLDPNSAFINYDIGVVYAKLRDYPNSLLYSKKAVDIKPDFAEALNNLCYAQSNLGNYNKAIENCEKSLEINPHSAATIDSLGYAYFGKGDIDNAIKTYIKAIKYDNSIGEIFFHLAEAYDQKLEYAKALANYKTYLELDKEAYNKITIEKRIKELEKIVSAEDLKTAQEEMQKIFKPTINLDRTSLDNFLKGGSFAEPEETEPSESKTPDNTDDLEQPQDDIEDQVVPPENAE